mmetsp:Transcript_15229/g.15104  ORF Transcript_15229/g.15104 Transcript_15229/m.15104 type:complete len:276 (-) Transcript_15229:19-846(-)
MISYERCVSMLVIPQEDPKPYEALFDTWPQHGKIQFKNFHLRYRPDTELVLTNLNFTIPAKHKVGVVGRTGAGKSTICLALCRIVEADSGCIEIDGRDISELSLQNLRDEIAIIPQDPTLFEGTLRYNLDPQDTRSGTELLEVLKLASLDDLVARDDKGLDQQIEDKGANLSSGERQLICICRAILRKSKIVLMDEATANIDIKTEQAIQKLIHDKFKDATVITIAHRLNTIIQSDKVLVLDKGQVAEYDNPQTLLEDPSSMFYSLAKRLSKSQE